MIDIDFVLPWLDHKDHDWCDNYYQYSNEKEFDFETRFRDWGWLRFWLRGVECYAPWVHRIFILSVNPRPSWLKADHPKLVWVDHKEFIPSEYLPTFCANTIELNLHRIDGLSEHFVYFNDDMLLNAPVSPEYYFRNGMPVDASAEALFYMPHCENGTWGTQIMEYCNVGLLKRHFHRSEVVKGNWWKWYGSYLPISFRIKAFLVGRQSEFVNFYTPHLEKPLLKSVFDEVWDAEPVFLKNSCSRFRKNFSANVYLMRLWHLASNRFYPDRCRLKGHYYEILPETINAICFEIEKGHTSSICLNDVPQCNVEFYHYARQRIISSFLIKYPHPSSFEQ